MRNAAIIFLIFLISSGCAGEDGDSASDTADDSADVAADDDTDSAQGDDSQHDWPDDDTAPACAQMIDPPGFYQPREAAWVVARFEGDDLPVLGMYAYFVLDWYDYLGCSYSSNWAILYKRDGAIDDNFVSGGYASGFDVDFGQSGGYDIFVHPRMRVHSDEGIWSVELHTPQFEGQIALRTRFIHEWNRKYFSAYDAEITDASIEAGGETFEPRGDITIERWWDMGGFAPGDPDGDIKGCWLYEPFSWQDENGERVSTLSHIWMMSDGANAWTHFMGGEMSIGEQRFDIAQLEWDLDFPENANSGGYPMRHTIHGVLSDAREFSYEVSVVKEFRDPIPDAWQPLYSPERREAHSLNEGSMQFDGKTYTGGGVYEWRVSDYNPLE